MGVYTWQVDEIMIFVSTYRAWVDDRIAKCLHIFLSVKESANRAMANN